MIDFERVYDISVALGTESTVWPGDPPYSRELLSSIAAGGGWDLSLVTMTAHTGTHVDTPRHILADGARLDDYTPRDFILPAVVIEVGEVDVVAPEAVVAADVPPGGAVLFKTPNSTTGRIAAGAFYDDGVALSVGAARACLDAGAKLVGIDYFSADVAESGNFPVHRLLMGAGVLILETINLRDVPAGAYTLICLPLRLSGAEASPVRAVLLA